MAGGGIRISPRVQEQVVVSVELEPQVREIAISRSEMARGTRSIYLHDDQYDRRNSADLEQYGALNGVISQVLAKKHVLNSDGDERLDPG